MLTKEEAVALLGGSRKELPDSPQTPEEILEAMKAASNNHYREAIATNCHTFIEFTGLMNEYIKVCEQNLAKGIDFTQINAHTSEQPMEFRDYNIQYINSKLECIFKGLIFAAVAPTATSSTPEIDSSLASSEESNYQAVREYVPKGTARSDTAYFWYSYKDGRRTNNIHIPGGNVTSPLAKSRAIEVRSAIEKGMPPAEIVKMIAKW